MFDKYYKKIGCQDEWNTANSYEGAHYLMSWYTSWGGTTRSDQGAWAWQIGASHCHEFYQNPLAAYALLEDDDLRNGMKTGNQALRITQHHFRDSLNSISGCSQLMDLLPAVLQVHGTADI